MTRSEIFAAIAKVSLAVVGLAPLMLCFGFLSDDPTRFVHNIFSVIIYGLLIGLVSLVIALMG